MRPPYINNKSQLENFGRLLLFLSEKDPLEESEPLTEIRKLLPWQNTAGQNFCNLWRAGKGYRQHSETTILLLVWEIPWFVHPQGSPHPILLSGTGMTRKTLMKNVQTFCLQKEIQSDTPAGSPALEWDIFGKTLILGFPSKATQNLWKLRIP